MPSCEEKNCPIKLSYDRFIAGVREIPGNENIKFADAVDMIKEAKKGNPVVDELKAYLAGMIPCLICANDG